MAAAPSAIREHRASRPSAHQPRRDRAPPSATLAPPGPDAAPGTGWLPGPQAAPAGPAVHAGGHAAWPGGLGEQRAPGDQHDGRGRHGNGESLGPPGPEPGQQPAQDRPGQPAQAEGRIERGHQRPSVGLLHPDTLRAQAHAHQAAGDTEGQQDADERREGAGRPQGQRQDRDGQPSQPAQPGAAEPVSQPACQRHHRDQPRGAHRQGQAEQPVGEVQPHLDAGDPGDPDAFDQAEDHVEGQRGGPRAAQLARRRIPGGGDPRSADSGLVASGWR